MTRLTPMKKIALIKSKMVKKKVKTSKIPLQSRIKMLVLEILHLTQRIRKIMR
jgi:hypothetical protein